MSLKNVRQEKRLLIVLALASVLPLQAERRAYREAEINMMDDISEGDSHKEDEPASPAPPPSQQHTDPASPTVAVTPEPVARGEQATPSDIEYQVNFLTSLTLELKWPD